MFAENYAEANKYFRFSSYNEFASDRVYSYLQTGDIEQAKVLKDKGWSFIKSQLDAEVNYGFSSQMYQPLAIKLMEITYLEGDIDQAIVHLKKAMEENYIINIEYKIHPMYKLLRAHPDWLTILAESNLRAKLQRDLYFKLIDDGNTTF